MPSENGWEPAKASPDQCEWITVPGTNPPVSLQLLKGWPLDIMRAVAADFNAFIQPLRDGDSAARTETNSVPTSNHLNATAMDLDWDDHPFHVRGTFNADQMGVIRELLAFYEDTIFWAGDWNDPIDEMHWQMGYDTFNNPHTGDFIARKIRADGFSTFRRDNVPVPPPPPPPASNAVDVLARATGVTPAKAAEILPTVIDGLRLSQCTNVNRVAMWLAQMGHESASFVYTEEIQSGDESTDRWLYKGRTWIQITWKANYADFSAWLFGKGLISSPTYFVEHPKELADQKWAGIGPAWYWTVQRSDINALSDAKDIELVSRRINGTNPDTGRANGIDDRINRWNRALALGDQLLALTTDAPPTQGEDDLSAEAERMIADIHREITQPLSSRSPLRHLGEGAIDRMAGFLLNADGSEHVEICRLLAGYGHPPTLALLREVAAADPAQYPDRQSDRLIAQAILADVTSAPPAVAAAPVTPMAATVAPQVVYLPAPPDTTKVTPPPAALPAPVSENGAAPTTTGQAIGALFDALESMRLADALPIEARAPLSALISVLQTKNGSQL